MISKSDERIINLMQTFYFDMHRDEDKHCHVACLCQGHKVLSMHRNSPGCHAEINAIKSRYSECVLRDSYGYQYLKGDTWEIQVG